MGMGRGKGGLLCEARGGEISFCKRGEEGREDGGRQGGTRSVARSIRGSP
jgi:hypothetical protein